MTEPTRYPYRIDLHVQRSALQENGHGPVADHVADLLETRDLAGVVVTEHDALPPESELADLARSLRPKRVYRGAEISTSEGHCLVIGLQTMTDIEPGISTWDLVKRADEDGAAVVLAHPSLPTPLTPQPAAVADMAPGIHGIEVMSLPTASTAELEARLIAHERGWTMVGGSDTHSFQGIGAAVSAFPRIPEDEHDLAAMIRVGAIRPERSR